MVSIPTPVVRYARDDDVVNAGGGGGRSARGGRSSGYFALGALMIVLMVFATQYSSVEAKRGCANFGHSCYGGMGKRANALNDEFASQEDPNDGEADPALVFTGPRSAPRPWTSLERILPQQAAKQKMSPYMKEFLRLYYRNMQLQQLQHGLNEE